MGQVILQDNSQGAAQSVRRVRRRHTRDRVTRLTATLDHAALVRRGAYPGARLSSAHGAADPLQLIARLRRP